MECIIGRVRNSQAWEESSAANLEVGYASPCRNLAEGLPPNPLTGTQLTKMISDFLAGKDVKVLSPDEAVAEEEGEEE